ncbi:hypothetical protein EFP86_11050 [Lentilactobacillus hilgardii]|nr:hypothetical protein [Lentilactobacillus hilgardii]
MKSEQIDIKLIVFPELSTTGYECGTGVYQLAETATGQSVQYMQNVAKWYRVYLIFKRDQTLKRFIMQPC